MSRGCGKSVARRGGRRATCDRGRRLAFCGIDPGVFRERPDHGLQERRLGATALFVLRSTSPANAAVPWSERLRWFVALRELVGADQPR